MSKIQADGAPPGPVGGPPRAPDETGQPLAVRLRHRNPKTVVFGSDGGPSRVRHCSSGVRVWVGLQAIPEGDLGRCGTAGDGGAGMSYFS